MTDYLIIVKQDLDITQFTKKRMPSTSQTYMVNEKLGTGGFAECYQVDDPSTGEMFALKVVFPKPSDLPDEEDELTCPLEAALHARLSNRHIVRLYRVFEDSEGNTCYLMELCGKSLFDLLKKDVRVSEEEAKKWMFQLANGVKAMHSQNVIHRDLKLENLLFDSNMGIKIADFGLAVLAEPTKAFHGFCGTTVCMAPEVLESKPYSFGVDVWALGNILYAMLVGSEPFIAPTNSEIRQKIFQGQVKYPQPANPKCSVSQPAKDLISRILVTDPSKRITVDQILSHDFFQRNAIPTQVSLALKPPQKTQKKEQSRGGLSQLKKRGPCYEVEEFKEDKKGNFVDHNGKVMGKAPVPNKLDYDDIYEVEEIDLSAFIDVPIPKNEQTSASLQSQGLSHQEKEKETPSAGGNTAVRTVMILPSKEVETLPLREKAILPKTVRF